MPSSRSAEANPNIHATCVARAGQGVLLLGPSGSGKSDLALRLLDRGWQLVSDDRVHLQVRESTLHTCAIASIDGLLEVRGLGIVKVPNAQQIREVPVVGAINLVGTLKQLERMPADQSTSALGVNLPRLDLYAFEASAALKVEWFLNRILDKGAGNGA